MAFDTVTNYVAQLFKLLTSSYTSKDKLEIFLKFTKMTVKLRILSNSARAEKICGKKWFCNRYSDLQYMFGEIFVGGEYSFTSTNKTPVILDVGANIGLATLFFKFCYPEAKVYAFEPNKTAYTILRKNIEINAIAGVETYNFAVTDKKGKIEFYIDEKSPGTNSTRAARVGGARKKVEVDSIALSAFITEELSNHRIDFLKMDIEGSEYESIPELYATKTLDKIREGVIEYHHKIGGDKSKLGQFLGYFEKAGFEYQIVASNKPIISKNKFQDILIYFYKT